jgi:hypothetical protein
VFICFAVLLCFLCFRIIEFILHWSDFFCFKDKKSEFNRLGGHVTCLINQVETKIQKGLSELLLNREASYSRLVCRSGCSVIASHKRRSVILTPLYPFVLRMIDDGRSSVEYPLSFIHCMNQERHYKIQLLTKMLFKLRLP